MSLHSESHAAIDISPGTVVLSFTYTGQVARVVICRVELGSDAQPVVGGGNYVVAAKLNGKNVSPDSVVAVGPGVTQTVLQSRDILLETNDVVLIQVTGQTEDTAVDTVAKLEDLTPLTRADAYGDGSTAIDHNHGGTDKLRYVNGAGAGIDNAQIQAFLVSDYAANRRSAAYVRGTAKTAVDGRWAVPLMLDVGSYVLVFFKQGQYGPDIVNLTVAS